MNDRESLGKRVLERRAFLRITQEDLSAALGITAQHISLIEHGKGSPSLSLLPRLAEALGVSVDYLVVGKASVVTEVIPAIKADERISNKVKNALIALIEEIYATTEKSNHSKIK